jgi:uncharacterized membrane protein YozB (DUF420 family)
VGGLLFRIVVIKQSHICVCIYIYIIYMWVCVVYIYIYCICAAWVCIYSGPASYHQLDIRSTWVTTKIFVLTYDQISSYDPRKRQRGEHISGITCSSLRALAVFACFAGATTLIPLIKVCTVQYKQISSYRKRVCIAHGTF